MSKSRIVTLRFGKPPARKQSQGSQQDWIVKRLQGGRAHPLAACGVATLGNPTLLRFQAAVDVMRDRRAFARTLPMSRSCYSQRTLKRRFCVYVRGSKRQTARAFHSGVAVARSGRVLVTGVHSIGVHWVSEAQRASPCRG